MATLLRQPSCSRAISHISPRRLSLIPTPMSIPQSQSQSQSRRPLTTIPTTSEPPPQTSSPAQSSSPSTTSSPVPEFEPLTYHVHRTPSSQLPIYHLAKAGGNKHLTRIRKISGSIEDLRDDLRKALGLGEKEVVVNSLSGHIIVKGWKKFEVARFLEEKRF